MAKTLGVSKVSRNFQTSIPPEVREDLGLKVGEFIAFVKEDKRIFIEIVDFSKKRDE